MRAEFFMEELNNGVKLCQLIGVLQTKIAQSCPTALGKVSQTARDENSLDDRPKGSFHAHTRGDVWGELCRSQCGHIRLCPHF